MTTLQIRAITWLTLVGAAFLSIVLPVLVGISDVGPDFILSIFAPGFLVMSPVHNVLPALIVAVVVDAIVYCAVAYAMLRLVLSIVHTHDLRKLAARQAQADAQQVVGPERGKPLL